MVRKNYFMLMLALAGITGRSAAQQCATDVMHQKYLQMDPRIGERERQLNEAISRTLSRMDLSQYARTTTSDAGDVNHEYDIPVVVHIMHNYGTEYLPDDEIYKMIADLNKVYQLQNDTSAVIAPFKKYVGNARIRFHLATKDPNGNRTKGITRRFTYLTYGGDDQAKMDLWPPTNYYNMWIENVIGRGAAGGTVLAYATFPSMSASFPFYDGIMCAAPYIHTTNTIEHETGHYLGLYHPWNSSGGDAGSSCGDDQVDDTPPTKGSYTCNLFDTSCAGNYFKLYTSASGMADSLVDYPDTVNKQNIMDYATCPNMFTKGQAYRMRSTLDASVASRDNLTKPGNLALTGALDPYPDLPPVADFTVRTSASPASQFAYFALPGTNVTFFNKSWGDTVTSVNWTFGNGASVPTAAGTNTVTVNFTQGGWAPVTMAVAGNNSGTTTTTFSTKVFVADPVATNANGYYQEFDPAGDVAKWPTFNYYGNEFKWEAVNTGFYDGNCIRYHGYDNRVNTTATPPSFPFTGTPRGDYDDLFSAPIDLSAFSDYCNLNFWYSGASRSAVSTDINDTLYIDYSTNRSNTWTSLVKLGKSELLNKGAVPVEYVPMGMQDWAPKTIPLPAAARTPYTVFRFRYKPGVSPGVFAPLGDARVLSTGNDFYMDRISFSRNPAEASHPALQSATVVVVPNPTHGNAWVIVKDGAAGDAHITVTDVTGKTVYSTTQPATAGEMRVEIPHTAITAAGLYLVQTTAGGHTNTQKLVVY